MTPAAAADSARGAKRPADSPGEDARPEDLDARAIGPDVQVSQPSAPASPVPSPPSGATGSDGSQPTPTNASQPLGDVVLPMALESSPGSYEALLAAASLPAQITDPLEDRLFNLCTASIQKDIEEQTSKRHLTFDGPQVMNYQEIYIDGACSPRHLFSMRSFSFRG